MKEYMYSKGLLLPSPTGAWSNATISAGECTYTVGHRQLMSHIVQIHDKAMLLVE